MAAAFEHFIIVQNPVSTRARQAALRIAMIKEALPHAKFTMFETSPDGRSVNMALLRRELRRADAHTLVCIAAGDGTVNMVLESMLADETLPAHTRAVPILPLWGGNANDLAHMLNGSSRQSLQALLARGKVVELFPLICTLTDMKGQKTIHFAACYTSFGASATTAHTLNKSIRMESPLYRVPPIRFTRELWEVVIAMKNAPTFRMEESGKNKIAYEYIFFKGPRFAKVSGVKRHLADRTFHRALVERKRFSAVMTIIASLTRQRYAQRFESTHADFMALETTWAQFDGEVMRIKPGTKVDVRISPNPFYALSTRIPSKTSVELDIVKK